MAEKTLKQIRDSIVAQYKKDYPDEDLYGKVFSLYVLDRYSRLLLGIYMKAGRSGE
jgi:hypothetical protein